MDGNADSVAFLKGSQAVPLEALLEAGAISPDLMSMSAQKLQLADERWTWRQSGWGKCTGGRTQGSPGHGAAVPRFTISMLDVS